MITSWIRTDDVGMEFEKSETIKLELKTPYERWSHYEKLVPRCEDIVRSIYPDVRLNSPSIVGNLYWTIDIGDESNTVMRKMVLVESESISKELAWRYAWETIHNYFSNLRKSNTEHNCAKQNGNGWAEKPEESTL